MMTLLSLVAAVWSSAGLLSGKEYQSSQVRTDGLNWTSTLQYTTYLLTDLLHASHLMCVV